MISAYLFVHLDTEYNGENVLENVREISQVKFAHRLYGAYDMVLFMEIESTEELKSVTLESVRKLKFVESTVTFLALDSYEKDTDQ